MFKPYCCIDKLTKCCNLFIKPSVGNLLTAIGKLFFFPKWESANFLYFTKKETNC